MDFWGFLNPQRVIHSAPILFTPYTPLLFVIKVNAPESGVGAFLSLHQGYPEKSLHILFREANHRSAKL